MRWLPFMSALVACDAGGLAVPVPLLDVPGRVQLEAELDTTSYVEVPIANVGSGAAEVVVEVTAPFALDVERFDIAAGEASGSLVSWRPSTFDGEIGSLTVTAGTQAREVWIVATVSDDVDGDGYRDERAGGADCDDSRSSVHPGADDACGDGLDADCDGADPPC